MTDEKDQIKPEIVDNANGSGNDQAVQFTQEQIDVIVKERLERSKAKTTADLMAQLGIENVDEAKKAIEDAAKLKLEQMSELEKAQAQITEAMNQAAQAKADMEAMQIKANEALLKSAIISKAQNFNDPMDAYAFINVAKIETGEDGSYSGIDEALKTLVENKPYLIKQENGNTPGTPSRSKTKTINDKLLQDRNKAEMALDRRPTIRF